MADRVTSFDLGSAADFWSLV